MKRQHRAVECRTPGEAERQERQEENRRERTEEIGVALRGILIIWDILSVLVH